MPRLSAEAVTTVEVELSTRLLTKLKAKLGELRSLKRQAKIIKVKLEGGTYVDDEGTTHEISGVKAELETLFIDADEYDALENGVRVKTPFGEVPMKIIKGQTAGRLNLKKLMVRCKITPKDIAACTDPPKPKKPYLGVFLPGTKDDEGGEE